FGYYGIGCVPDVLCKTREQAVQAANQMGYPVVAKVEAAEIRHKSDIGGVRRNLANASAVEQAYDQIHDAVARHGAQAAINGVSIQKRVPAGVEMMIGARQGPQFGPLVVFGFGGTLVEVLHDV